MLQFASTSGLYQFVRFATRCENLLNLVLTKDSQKINSISPYPPLGHSDRVLIHFTLGLQSTTPHEAHRSVPINILTSKYAWRNGDYNSIALYLQTVDWCNLIYYNPSAESAWDAFTVTLWNAIDQYVLNLVKTIIRHTTLVKSRNLLPRKDNVTGLSSGNKCNQNLHSPGVGLHVDTTAHFSSL